MENAGLRLYDLKTGAEHCMLGDPNTLFGQPIAFSPDSRLLAVPNCIPLFRPAASMIRVYDILTGLPLADMEAPLGHNPPVAFSADGRLVASLGIDDQVHIWETTTGKRLLQLPAKGKLSELSYDGFSNCLAWSPDGKTLATGHAQGTIVLWDMTPAWQALAHIPGPLDTAACWEALADVDPEKSLSGHRPIGFRRRKIAAFAAAKAVPVKVDPQWLATRLADLDSDNFAVREAAERDLNKVAAAVESDLRRVLENPPSLEAHNRLVAILKTLDTIYLPVPPPQQLRQLRGITVLERIGSTEARALLDRWPLVRRTPA